MKGLYIQRYSEADKQAWDTFVSSADVHSVLFYRDFMEYHGDRFTDYSLMIFRENKLIAIFPANKNSKGAVHSHQGLSYGGIIFKPFAPFEIRLKVYEQLLNFLDNKSIKNLYIKSIPSCYSKDNSDYLIFQWLEAECVRTDIYSYIPKASYIKPNRNRMRHLKNAMTAEIEIRSSNGFSEFWNQILIPNLEQRFNVKPVHSIAEIEQLALSFKKQIRFYGAYQNGVIRVGLILFIHRDVVHAQYSAGDENRDDGSLDLLLDFVIKKYNPKKVFSFGTSSEEVGSRLNKGLLYWKESFRVHNDVQTFYSIETKNVTFLENRLR